MKHIVAILALWLIAVVGTVLVVNDAGVFTYLAPLYAICAIGSVFIVRRALDTVHETKRERETD